MKLFETALLYVLSGTGNTYRVACWIKDYFQQAGITTRLKAIENAEFQTDFQDAGRQLTMVLFPAHGFMPPWSMIKFLFRMPRQKGLPVMAVATRGALRIGAVKIPGAAGFGTFFAALILWLKGYNISGFFSLDMPSNFINFHPGLSRRTVEIISEKARARLKSFISPVLSGRRVLLTFNNLYEGLWTVALFWLIPIFPIIYLVYGKTTMAKIMFANNQCDACGLCARFCPNHGIEMKRFFGKTRPFWTYHCENCMRCMGYCPKKAVEAGHSWAVLQFFFVSIPVMAWILSWVGRSTGVFIEIQNYWLMALVDIFYYIPALLLSYWLFWMLIRFPVFNTIFSVSTLTHYYPRYHEPDTRIKALVGRNSTK